MAAVHIALTFDDGFWAPAYATMRSICLASRDNTNLVFHLFHRGLSKVHRGRIDAIGTEFSATLVDYDLDHNQAFIQFLEGMSFHPKLTNMVYARLMLDALLPKDITRFIYVDCDMMVRAPIEELAEMSLAGKAVAAVLDPHRHRAMLGRDFLVNRDLFSFNYPYFNAGLLVADRVAYGAAHLPERTRAYHEAGVLKRVQYDQAVLNLVFHDNWLPLDFSWNLINPLPAHENLEPKLVHYTGPNKPWHLLSRAAFSRTYRHVMTNEIFYDYWRERLIGGLKKPFRRLIGRR